MDINQSSLSRSKSNKPVIARTVSENKALMEASKSRETTHSSSMEDAKPLLFREGQLVKGQVLDHRYNEVKLQIEPTKQVITAKLAGDFPLSIGQEAQFLVTKDSSGLPVLRYLPSEASTPEDLTITKALSASNLPQTLQNKLLVSELLAHRLPIDKQTLQSLVKYALTNKEASPLTLVLMYKNNIPMTTANIRQFEAYQNDTHQLLKDIRTLTGQISDLFQASVQCDPTGDVNPLPMGPASTITQQAALQLNDSLMDILYPYNSAEASSNPLIRNLLNPEEFTLFIRSVEQKITDTPDFVTMKPIDNSSLTLEDSLKLITKQNLTSSEEPNPLIHPSGPSYLHALLDAVTKNSAELEVAPIYQKLIAYAMSQHASSTPLSEVLDPRQLLGLSHTLTFLSDSDAAIPPISMGTISVKEALTLIRDYLTTRNRGEAEVAKVLSSSEYHKLIAAAFLDKWTITPEKLAKKTPLSDLYQGLSKDLEQLSSLLKEGAKPDEIRPMQEPVKNLQENLQFMKDLNQVFTYLQLPLQLLGQHTHGDLYVLSQKKALQDHKENLSVLLHLTMEHLGPLNVYLRMERNLIRADFYLSDANTCQMIEENLPSLSEALQKKGYLLHTKVKEDYKKPDFSKDFIEDTAQEQVLGRYTFDIRM